MNHINTSNHSQNKNKKVIPMTQVIDVKNRELDVKIETYLKEKNVDNLDDVASTVRNLMVFVPAMKNEKGVTPALIKSPAGTLVLPCFTTTAHVSKSPVKADVIMTMPFLALTDAALKASEEVVGIAMNPFSHNVTFTRALLALVKDNKKVKDQPVPEGKVVKMQVTEEMANQLERFNFESIFLPKKFFEDPKALADVLKEKKEEGLDELFESSYQNKRLYPYLTEEFHIFSFTPDDRSEVVRIDMPERMLETGNASKIYLIKNGDAARYFSIVKGKEKSFRLLEIGNDMKRTDHGEAPEEGAELFTVMKLAGLEE